MKNLECRKKLKRNKLMLCALTWQFLLCCLFGYFVRYGSESNGALRKNSYHEYYGGSGKRTLPNNFYMFQDVHIMMFIGFGFLLTLIRRSNSSSTIASYFLIVATSLQWGTLCYGFFRTVNGKIHVNLESLLNVDCICAGVLISSAAIVDRTNSLQLYFMSLLQIVFASTNKWLGSVLLQVSDIGSSMFVHAFGAYFGLAVHFVLQRRCNSKNPTLNERNAPQFNSITSATVRTLFLWLLWPSFNACLAKEESEQFRAIINTYYSLAASCVTAFAVSTLLSNCSCKNDTDKDFNMVLFHNSTLVGGVAIGTSADMMINIWGAMIVGGLAGAGSVIIDRFINKAIHRRLGISDTWGVNTLHGLPGIAAGLVGAIASATATKEDYWFSLYRQFPARSPVNGSSEFSDLLYYDIKIEPGQGRTASEQAGYQVLGLVLTLAISIVSGLVTGMVLSLPFFQSTAQESELLTEEQSASILTENLDTEADPSNVLSESFQVLERMVK